jgi:hypothetical protein
VTNRSRAGVSGDDLRQEQCLRLVGAERTDGVEPGSRSGAGVRK